MYLVSPILVTKYSGLSGFVTANSSATRLLGRSGTLDFHIEPPASSFFTASRIFDVRLSKVCLGNAVIWRKFLYFFKEIGVDVSRISLNVQCLFYGKCSGLIKLLFFWFGHEFLQMVFLILKGFSMAKSFRFSSEGVLRETLCRRSNELGHRLNRLCFHFHFIPHFSVARYSGHHLVEISILLEFCKEVVFLGFFRCLFGFR